MFIHDTKFPHALKNPKQNKAKKGTKFILLGFFTSKFWCGLHHTEKAQASLKVDKAPVCAEEY